MAMEDSYCQWENMLFNGPFSGPAMLVDRSVTSPWLFREYGVFPLFFPSNPQESKRLYIRQNQKH